ncbi:hypothetical protein BO85DRAFT_142578 [Aspergillus piperis CBS 112811]|uniref:Uncharacterized protein n=1 Tax=Aspergillus piperis CBS 112811 TaxID=1448313 RepID=A0A8G1QWH5_9EURO|nr:hypothetical protein BO85DRAFT_142578 [Aspergillus piperis CBS 112811]RAH54286.1 hypothetical protein BO85DRAFT_142578 [Aspergillus piperis CBS 112811]
MQEGDFIPRRILENIAVGGNVCLMMVHKVNADEVSLLHTIICGRESPARRPPDCNAYQGNHSGERHGADESGS